MTDLLNCPFCGLTLYKCVYETDRARWAHDANGCVMSRRFIPASAIAAWNRRALPPVDGLEVVGHVKPDHPEVVDPLFVRELSQPWMDGIFTEPVVTLSQASSVIAGLTAERDEAIRRGEDQWAGWVKEEVARKAAEARISSLEEENRRLREAIDAIADFDDPDDSLDPNVIHLIRIAGAARRAARQALGDHNG